MARLAAFVGINFDKVLTIPSLYGKPWTANSSSREMRIGTQGRIISGNTGSRGLSKIELAALKMIFKTLPPPHPDYVFGE